MSQRPIDVFADCMFGEPRCVVRVGDHEFILRCFDLEQANNARAAVVTALETVQTDAIRFDNERQRELAYQREQNAPKCFQCGATTYQPEGMCADCIQSIPG